MAKKKSAKQGASGSTPSEDSRNSQASKVSRKVLRGTSAPYERKDKSSEEGGKGKKDDEQASAGTGQREEGAKKDGREQAGQPAAAGDAHAPDDVSLAWPSMTDYAGSKEPGDAGKKEAASSPEEAKDEAKAPAAAAADEEKAAEKAAPAAAAAEDAAAASAEKAAAATAPGGEQAGAAEPEVEVLLPPHRIENGDPDALAPPPGKAPAGDSRSFRRYRDGVAEFVLIYRNSSFLISRAGQVGRQGTWTIVEYPTIGTAAHAYAQECSKLTAEGYRDLR